MELSAVRQVYQMFFPTFLKLSQDKSRLFLDLLWSLEFGTSSRCNCFTMLPLSCAVTKTAITYGALYVFFLSDLRNPHKTSRFEETPLLSSLL